MIKAIIYTRFSPRRMKEHESESCEVQQKICETFAKGRDYEVVNVFHDKNISGGDQDRPILWQAIGALKRGYVLVVFKRDRLARDIILAETINRVVKSKGASIEAVEGDIEGDGPEHELARLILDLVAQYLRKCNAAQTSFHMKQHQANGKRMGRYAPYGYRIHPDDVTRLTPVESEQEIIRLIEKLNNEGKTVYAITKELNDQELPSRGKEWRPKTVKKIIERL